MKTTTTVLFGAAFAVAMGLVAFSGMTPNALVSAAPQMQTESNGIMGHITMTAFDSDGNIVSYIQTDNIVTNAGEDCIANDIFAIDSASENCALEDTAFDVIRIGNRSDGTVAESNTALDNQIAQSHADSSGVSQTAASGSTGNIVTVTATFPINGTLAIDGSALANAGNQTTNDLLAIQEFADINVSNGDTLQVDWQITIG